MRNTEIGIRRAVLVVVFVTALSAAQGPVLARQQSQPSTPPASARGGRSGSAYPTHAPADSALVERGKQLFGVNCSFCHGPDARGGEGGPNLLRSEVVLDDQNGEGIAVVVQSGRPDRGMPKFDLNMADVEAIAAFIHSFPLRGSEVVPASAVLVGDPKAGEAYFNGYGRCTTCHSVTGDLAGIGARYDARTLETRIVMPGRGRGPAPTALPPTTARVTLPSGQIVEGTLNRIDDFSVSLTDANGDRRTFVRNGASPKVEMKDPLQAHKALWPTITDDEIHDLTAYLASLK
ncbi:MAG TPA: c-type cytochrome [Candidatus Aquilonibacter sp.]|nr:c-type cytochrome [Candidatus Aquilonibacter sp.]